MNNKITEIRRVISLTRIYDRAGSIPPEELRIDVYSISAWTRFPDENMTLVVIGDTSFYCSLDAFDDIEFYRGIP